MIRILILSTLMALSACAGARQPLPVSTATLADTAWAQANTVEIALADFSFEPQTLTVDANRPYKLRFVNNGSGGHNFDSQEFFRTAQFRTGEASDRVRASGGIVELKRGETLDLYLVPATAGKYAVECSHTLHASFGMIGSVVVR